ncbi:hypothetical protein [Eubacterium sp. 1001713B170207_170306_E7]|nr:hypothetical protein [Eubacterium sp. 1001713B170207_170306_E7]
MNNDDYTVAEIFEVFKNDPSWEEDPAQREMLLAMLLEALQF